MRVGVQVGAHPVGVRARAQVGAQVGRRAPDYMPLGVPVGVGVLVGDAAPRWTCPLTIERIFLAEAAPRFMSELQRGPIRLS